jgi:oxygen-independent coproporphyrinogen-3 oxidase
MGALNMGNMPLQIITNAVSSSLVERSILPRAQVAGLYVHIPFCFHKCGYCDFYSITRQSAQRMERFVDLLLREAEGWARWNGDELLRPGTVFFGGGTPSLLPLDSMRRLILGLKERMDFSGCVEWTVEVNPATVSEDYCRMLRECGVSRLSMGAQSFDRAELKLLERHHEPEDVGRSLQMARGAGFERINVDLIYAIPGQSVDGWMRNLEKAIELGTEHLSCYGLTYESNTPMTVRKRLGQFLAAEEAVELEMLRQTRRRLCEAGMPAYEISNYARPGAECRHNLVYWMGENYLGIGPAAASHLSGWRWKNLPHLGQWESAMETGSLPATELEELPPRRRAGELAMLQLRLARGINFSEFGERTGYDARELFGEVSQRLERAGLIERDEVGIRLTEVGLPVADGIAAEFLGACGES